MRLSERYASPMRGGSTLTTSAPKSPRTVAAAGPAMKLARSTTCSPSRRGVLLMTTPCPQWGRTRRPGSTRRHGAPRYTPGSVARRHGHEGVVAGDVAADDQRLHGVGALVRVDRLDVAQVPGDVVVEQDAVAAEHVAGVGEDGPGPFGVVHLGQRDPGHRVLALVQELAEPELHAQHVGDVRQHPGEPVLDE